MAVRFFQRNLSRAPRDGPGADFTGLQPLRPLPVAERVAQRVGRAETWLDGKVEVRTLLLEWRPTLLVDPHTQVRDLARVERHLELIVTLAKAGFPDRWLQEELAGVLLRDVE